MAAFTVKSIESMETRHHGVLKLAAAELGVESFGMQILDFPPGFSEYPEHDHAEEGMEEVYLVLSGAAEFEVDGTRVPIDSTRMLRIAPQARRRLTPGPEGVRILAIGCTCGQPYVRPESFQLAVHS